VISILEAAIPRHRRAVEDLGLASSLAGDRAIGLPWATTPRPP
jgi:hypothetical protein